MITVKTAGYSVEEIQLLAGALTNTWQNLVSDCAGDLSRKPADPHCIKCKYKYVCEDLFMASTYLEALAITRSKREEK